MEDIDGIARGAIEQGRDQRRGGIAADGHEFACVVVLGRHVDDGADQRHSIFGQLLIESAAGRKERRLLEHGPGVVARHAGIDVGKAGIGLAGRAAALPLAAAAMLGRGIVGEDALAVADRFADRLVGKIALGPDPPNQPLGHFARVDAEVVHQLCFLRKLLHDFGTFGADGVDRQAECKANGVVGNGFEQRDHFCGVDEAEGAGKDVDAATAGARTRQLQVGDRRRLLRKAHPDIAEAVVARRLSLKRGRSVDVGSAPGIGQERIHRTADVGVERGIDRRKGQGKRQQRGGNLLAVNSHGQLPWR